MTKSNQQEITYTCPLSDIVSVGNNPNPEGYLYKKSFSGKEFYLKEHILEGTSILPGVAYLEMAGTAFALLNNQLLPNIISHIAWAHPFCLGTPQIYLRLKKRDGFWQCSFNSGTLDNPILHAQLRLSHRDVSSNIESNINVETLLSHIITEYNKDAIFARFREIGANHGSSLRSLESVGLISNYQALGLVKLPQELDPINSKKDYIWHPSIMDGILQTAMGLFFYGTAAENKVFYPYSITDITFYCEVPLECYVYVERNKKNIPGKLMFDTIVFDTHSYKRIAEFNNITWLPRKNC